MWYVTGSGRIEIRKIIITRYISAIDELMHKYTLDQTKYKAIYWLSANIQTIYND